MTGCESCKWSETCTKILRVAPKTIVRLSGYMCQAYESRTRSQLIKDVYTLMRKQEKNISKGRPICHDREMRINDLKKMLNWSGNEEVILDPPMQQTEAK